MNLVQVNYKALFVRVELLDALPAEDGLVTAAVEVLDAVWVLGTELVQHLVFLLVVKVKLAVSKLSVFLHHFVQDVDVQGKSFCTLEVLDEFTADGASHSVVVVQLSDAAGTEGVPAMDEDSGDTLANIILETAELAYV